MRKFLSLLLCLCLLLTSIIAVPFMVQAAEKTETFDYSGEQVGAYTGEDTFDLGEKVDAQIVEEDGTKILKLTPQDGTTGKPGVYVVNNQATPGKVVVETRIRLSNYLTVGGSWQHHIRVDADFENRKNLQLMWINTDRVCIGAGPSETALVTFKDGSTKNLKDGSNMVSGLQMDGIWYRLRFELDPSNSKIKTGVFEDDGTFLASAEWTAINSFTDDTFVGLKLYMPYTYVSDGTVKRTVELSVSESKLTVNEEEHEDQGATIEQTFDYSGETVGPYEGDAAFDLGGTVDVEVADEDGTKVLKLMPQEGTTTRAGLYAVNNLDLSGKVTIDTRVRLSNFVKAAGSWHHNLRVDAILSNQARQLLWANSSEFCIGANISETALVTYPDGSTKSLKDGASMIKPTMDGAWYRYRFELDMTNSKIKTSIFADDGSFLASAEWTSASSFAGETFQGLKLYMPYPYVENGGVVRLVDISISDTKVTYTANKIAVTIDGAGKVEQDGTAYFNGDEITVPSGRSQVLSITPDNGYSVESVTYNGKNLIIKDGKVTTPVVTENGILAVKFRSNSEKTCRLSFDVGDHGRVLAGSREIASNSKDEIEVGEGADLLLRIMPDVGYRVRSLIYDGSNIPVNGSGELILQDIAKDAAVTVSFEERVNLLENADFEDTFDPWQQYPAGSDSKYVALSQYQGDALNGSGALQVNYAVTCTLAYDMMGAFQAKPAKDIDLTKQYVASAWLKSTDGKARKVHTQIFYRMKAGSTQKGGGISGSSVEINGDGWTQTSIALQPSEDLTPEQLADLDRIEIGFGCDKTSPTGTFLIDQAVLVEKAPMAREVSIQGAVTAENDKLAGSYSYYHYDYEAETQSNYRWLRGTDLEDVGSWEAVSAGTCTDTALPSYTVTREDYEQYLIFEIIPQNGTGAGNMVRSEPFVMPSVPTATDVAIEGGGVAGRELTGVYEYHDRNGDTEEGSAYRWLVSDTADGTYLPIQGATGKTYTIPQNMTGKFIKFEVTPKNTALLGDQATAVLSPALGIAGGNTAPVVENVRIEGAAMVRSTLTGDYDFSDADGDEEGTSEYRWYISDTEDGEYALLSGEIGKTMTIPDFYAGKYIKFEITPIDSYGSRGESVQSEPVAISEVVIGSLFVAPDGNDTNSGTKEAPFATLEAARDTIRTWKAEGSIPQTGVTVYLMPGTYRLTKSFELTEEDSGTDQAPIVYRPYGDGKVTLSGAANLNVSEFQPVSGDMKTRLKSTAAQNAVLVGDLVAMGITDIEEFSSNASSARYNLFGPMFEMDGKRMNLSRWPNSDYRTDWSAVKVKSTNPIAMTYSDETISGWSYHTEDIWYLGYWKYDWAAEFVKGTIDSAAKAIAFTTPTNYGAAGVNTQRPLRAYNIYEEIDEPGEWYIDHSAGKMYFYPLPDVRQDSVLTMTQADFDLVKMDGVSNVAFRGIELTGSRKLAVNINEGSNNTIENCDIHLFEKKAVSITGVNSRNNGLKNCKIYDCGGGAVDLSGGDLENITPAGNYVNNCNISDMSLMREVYSPAVELAGVGNIVSYNEFSNSPHQVIQFHGVENVMEYNTFHNVCKNAADMGVIYTGRRLDDQGNIIRYNHFYNVGNPIVSQFSPCCVFTDDGSSNLWVYGNVCGPGVDSCEVFKVHGGMNNHFFNNLLIDAPRALYQAGWDKNRWFNSVIGTQVTTLRDSYNNIKDNPLYSEKWPYLADMRATLGSASTFVYADKYPNVCTDNVFLYVNNSPGSNLLSASGFPVSGTNTNLQLKGNAALYKTYFKDWDNGNYTLTDAAYAAIREKIRDFPTLPFEAMGPAGVTNALPTAENVKIYRDPAAENALIGSYFYMDRERDPEGETTVRWLVADKDDEASYKPIDGATGSRFVYTDQYANKFIQFEVTPKDSSGRTGESVRSAAIRIITNKEGFLELIEQAEEYAKSATVGSGLGQYPQSALDAFKEAITAAREVYEDQNADTAAIAAAATALEDAREVFDKARGNKLVSDMSSGEVIIPDGLESIDLTFTNITDEIVLRGSLLPAGTIYATINGKLVTIEIPKPVTLANGRFPIGAIAAPGAAVTGELYLALTIGSEGEQYTDGLTVTIDGAAGKQLYRVTNGKLELISGAVNTGNALEAVFRQGGEYVITGTAAPSDDATLKKIMVNGSEIVCEAGKYAYEIELPYGTATATITAETNHSAATYKVSLSGRITVPGSGRITVTSQTGKEQVYTVKVTAAAKEATPKPSKNPSPSPTTGVVVTPGYPTNTTGGYGAGSILGNPENSSNQGQVNAIFADTAGHWAQSDIEALYQKGIVAGVTATEFEPERQITRAEFATLVVKALQLENHNSVEFADVSDGAWYAPYVNAAANAGLISGFAGYFRPDDVITREEMAVILAKAYEMRGGEEATGGIDRFADKDEISDWAQSYVDTVTTAGLISGMTPSTFAGKNYTTRAQAAAVLKRLTDRI